MKNIKLVCEMSIFDFENKANKLLTEGYEPIGSISVVHVEGDGWTFTQPFGLPK